MATTSTAEQWVSWDPCEETRQQVQAALAAAAASGDASALEHMFRGRLEFGTAGLRGPMGPGPSCMNDLTVIQTSQGLAVYLEEVLGADVVKGMGIAIGYDHRASASGALRSAQVRKPILLGMEVSELGHWGHQYGVGSSRYYSGTHGSLRRTHSPG